jgi:uncharacterized protein YcbX
MNTVDDVHHWIQFLKSHFLQVNGSQVEPDNNAPRKCLKLSQIFIYPIKSCGSISLDRAELAEYGLKYDRIFTLVDISGKIMTQKKYRAMCAIALQMADEFGTFVVGAPGMNNLRISLGDFSKNETVHNAWFSKYFKQSCKLVVKDCINCKFSNANTSQYLLVSQTSVDYVKSQLDNAPHFNSRSFRPNFVVSGSALPFEEDHWLDRRLIIGNHRFSVDALCERCQMICYDQKTGTAHKEPLSTLSKIKRVKVSFVNSGENNLWSTFHSS